MTRHPHRSTPSLRNLTPWVQPAAFSALFVIIGAGLACGGSDNPAGAAGSPGSAGRSSGAAGAPATAGSSPAGGASPGSAGAGAGGSGGTIGVAGGATAGAAPVAGSAGSVVAGGAGGAGGGGAAGSGSSGAPGGAGAGAAGGGATQWLGTWTASPYLAASDAQPPAALSNSVLRQVTHISVGGGKFRVQFSNKVGNGAVTIKSAHVALCKATPKVDGSIDTATDKALAFSGMPGVTIAQGMEVWSDAVDFAAPALSNITITTALGSVPSDLTAHAGARTNSYVQASSTDVSVANLTSAPKGLHWYFISGIDVMAPAGSKGIAVIGDSITDGRGTTDDGNDRWTDVLAARLQANAGTANVSVMNQGIGATNLIGTGTAAQARFARDVLGQSGIKYAIIYDGVNDIGGGASADSMKTAYAGLVSAAHAKNLVAIGATIPPFSGNSYYTAAHETVRTTINAYIKTAAFDGYIDFDTALTDGGNPPKLQATYAAWSQTDWLHPGPAGYKKMGDTPDLTLFTK